MFTLQNSVQHRLLLLAQTREIFFYPPDLQLLTFIAEEGELQSMLKFLEL